MSGERVTHRTTWEDERMAGVDCYVNLKPSIHPINRTSRDIPTYGGTASAGETHTCESCGAQMRLVWDVRLEPTPSEAPINAE